MRPRFWMKESGREAREPLTSCSTASDGREEEVASRCGRAWTTPTTTPAGTITPSSTTAVRAFRIMSPLYRPAAFEHGSGSRDKRNRWFPSLLRVRSWKLRGGTVGAIEDPIVSRQLGGALPSSLHRSPSSHRGRAARPGRMPDTSVDCG